MATYSHPTSVRRLAKLAYTALNSDIDGTDLALFAKIVAFVVNEETPALCKRMADTYGARYLEKAHSQVGFPEDDWLGESFRQENLQVGSSPWILYLRRFSDLLMTIDTLFGSWEEFDRQVEGYLLAA